MTDQINAIDALIEAVEAGTAPDELAIAMPDQMTINSVYAAYRGSVDAAMALKDAMLPGWAIDRMMIWPGAECSADLLGTHEEDGGRWHSFKDGRVEGRASTPARALLIATLKAYRHELEGRG